MSDKEAVKALIAHRIRFMDDFGWDKSTVEALDIAIASLSNEHPEKKRKTYAEDFREHFGHSWDNKNNNWQCRGRLYNDITDCVNSPRYDCEACWNEEMEGEDAEI